ncbi:hypothetical protein [Paenibacillus sp. L3-i20]|uniref:hypothetical protein n=1 Tax=Paenibacillus sp. L3-i20 TaxID=2905833 RepID=UPI001EE0F286|nr:hypothetical protein [Paenibacillus sp. L3-i20]GKU77079.1 hypothetical protein L3i20_v214760 [Paenibacillus sp. L3-i20]
MAPIIITPNVGIGPFKLGMSKIEVEEIMELNSKDLIPHHHLGGNIYENLFTHFEYDTASFLTFTEITNMSFYDEIICLYDGIDVFRNKSDEFIAEIEKTYSYNRIETLLESTFIFPDLNLWLCCENHLTEEKLVSVDSGLSPKKLEDETRRLYFSTVAVGVSGYFDSRLNKNEQSQVRSDLDHSTTIQINNQLLPKHEQTKVEYQPLADEVKAELIAKYGLSNESAPPQIKSHYIVRYSASSTFEEISGEDIHNHPELIQYIEDAGHSIENGVINLEELLIANTTNFIPDVAHVPPIEETTYEIELPFEPFIITPNVGVGPIKIGMCKSEVDAIVKLNSKERRTDRMHSPSLFNCVFAHFEYDSEDRLSFIALENNYTEDGIVCLYNGIDVFRTKADELVAKLDKLSPYDRNNPELGYSYIFNELNICLWRPSVITEEDLHSERFLEMSLENQQYEKRYLYFTQILVTASGYYK